MRVSIIVTIVALALAAGCSDRDPVPTVRIVEATPDALDTSDDLADDLSIRVAYTDGDGDLGGGVADVYDCRAEGIVTQLRLPAIASEEAVNEGVPIEGQLELVVTDVGDVWPDVEAPAICADLGVTAPAAGEAVFCVLVTDTAGNTSAGDCTAPVTIMVP